MITGWGGGKNIFDEVYAPDALWHLPDRDIHGVERFKRYLTPYINALPDLNATIHPSSATATSGCQRLGNNKSCQGHPVSGLWRLSRSTA